MSQLWSLSEVRGSEGVVSDDARRVTQGRSAKSHHPEVRIEDEIKTISISNVY